MRNHGRRPGDPWLHHTRVGFNYRLDELSAALGVAQMRRVDELLGRRRRVHGWYEEALAGVEGVRTTRSAPWAEPARFVESLRVGPGVDRDRLVEHLNRSGVEAKAYFDPPIHQQPPYAGRDVTARRTLPVTEEASARTLIVPFFSTMTLEEVDRVARTLATGLVEQGRPP